MSTATTIKVPGVTASSIINVSIGNNGEGRTLTASLFIGKKTSKMAAYIGTTHVEKCYVRINNLDCASLWLGNVAIDIPPKEAKGVADTLQLELVDERTKPEGK